MLKSFQSYTGKRVIRMSVIVAKISSLVTVAIPKLLFLYKKPWHFSVLVEIMLTFIHHDVNNMP